MNKEKELALIFAVNQVGTLGHEGSIPWKISGDLARFKRITLGNTVVMGRTTFESLGKPLPDRLNIVVSTTMNPQPGILVARSEIEAIDLYAKHGQGSLFIIGGVKLYQQFFEHAQRIYMTMVEDTFEGDTKYFPKLEGEVWKVSATQAVHKEDGTLSHTYITLARR